MWVGFLGLVEGIDVSPVPDQVSEEESSAADEPGRVRFLRLRARQRQPVVHVTLGVQNGLERWPFVIRSIRETVT